MDSIICIGLTFPGYIGNLCVSETVTVEPL